ncbi:MAG: hypothetical protein ACREYE_28300 [Gammaproteobacteria bacterium]
MAATTASAFDVYVETNYANQPNLSSYGIFDLRMIYAQAFWPTGASRVPLPSRQRVIDAVSGGSANHVIVLDIEHWPLIGSDAQIRTNVSKLRTVLGWAKTARPTAYISYYGVIPQGVYWAALAAPTSGAYREWQRKNNLGQALADEVSALYPNFYAVNANQNDWDIVARAKIHEAQRLGKGKPVYLVINPRYHSQAYDGLRFAPIPEAAFLRQLRTIKAAGATGVVIWGADNGNKAWSESLPWWKATKTFLATPSLATP